MKRILWMGLVMLYLFTGCVEQVSKEESSGVELPTAEKEVPVEEDAGSAYEESNAVQIQLNGTSATADSDSVQISGTKITVTEEATYIISGSLDEGMIIVNAPDTAKVQLVLNGVSINSEESAALYILEADTVSLTLADGTENQLSNGGTWAAIDENNIDAVVFSKQDLTLEGNGSLQIISPVGHGIVGKDDLDLNGGMYTIQSASHGLDVNDSVEIAGSTHLTIDAGKDGIHCENSEDTERGYIYIEDGTIDIEAEGDGLDAGAYVQIENGRFDLLTGGGSENGTKASSENYGGFMGGGPMGMPPGGFMDMQEAEDENSVSMKGIKATGNVQIDGGTFKIDSADDAIHSDVSVTIQEGTFEIASGDDAVHAEDTLTITDGIFTIQECYEGLEALHLDVQGGDIQLMASDDGLNAAGGNDGSGHNGGRDGMFGGHGGGPGGMGGGMSSESNGSITISGGSLQVKASGDGIDANGTLEISGGYTVVTGPTQGDTATLDYDTSAVITGGTFIGTGGSGMAQTFSDSEQGVFAVNVGNQTEGTPIELKDQNGDTLLSYTPELPYAVVILSSPEMVSGETYTITVGEVSGEFAAN